MTLSINTNNAAMAALESLSMTTSALNQTENRVSTGLKVGSAADNPAVYSIAQQMNGNIAGLSAVSDSLSFGTQVVSTANSAANNIVSTLQNLQQTVTSAGTSGISLSTMQTSIVNALNSINTYARASTLNGVNLLTTGADTGGTATISSLNVVEGLQGNSYQVGNQLTSLSGTAQTLTEALGLSTGTAAAGSVTSAQQQVLTGSSGGINISLGSALGTTDFSNNNLVKLTNGDGSTTTFEFVDGSTATTTPESATNHTVAVIVNTAAESSNQMVGDLVNAMNQNGYNAVVQTNGSINVVGKGVHAESSTGATDIGGGTGGAVTSLSTTQAAVTLVQGAINKVLGMQQSFGAASQQITGMQTFTKDLSDALTSSVGALTDADLSAESAKLTSLQTKQQLAIQSLSIANSQSQSILSLFRG